GVQVARGAPGHGAGGGAQPLDRLVERAPNGVVQKDGNERANAGYRRASRSWIRLRIPSCRSGSGSIASAARRSAKAPSWSPCSSFSRPRAASARESSGAGGSDATSRDGAALGGAASDAGGAGAWVAATLWTLRRVGAGLSTDGVPGTAAAAGGDVGSTTAAGGGAAGAAAAGAAAGAASAGAAVAGGADGGAEEAATAGGGGGVA